MIPLPRVLHQDKVILYRITEGDPDGNGRPTQLRTGHEWEGVNLQQVNSDESLQDGQQQMTRTYQVSGSNPPISPRYWDEVTIPGDPATFHISTHPQATSGAHRLAVTRFMMKTVSG